MKIKSNSITLWTRFKTSAKALAILAFAGGLATVAEAQVTFTPTFTNVWVLPAGSYADLPADANNTVRSVAISPVSTNVLYASRTAGTNNGVNHVSTVAFASGSNFLAGLSGSGFAAGTLILDQVRVADDGAVYACNLASAPASDFKVYKWTSELDIVDPPTVVFDTGPGTSFQWRIGDYMDLRGSGSNTEIVVVGNGSGANITTNFVILRPTDATATAFTNFSITIPGGVNNLCGAGVAFEGTNNAIWIRQAGSQNTRHIFYNPASMTAVCDRTNTVDQSVCQGLKYYSANGVQMLATVQPNTTLNAVQIARVFQIPTSPTGPFSSVLSSNIPLVTGSQNGNGLGNVDAKNGYFVFGAPGHGLSFFAVGFITNSPPSVTVSGSASTLIESFPVTFTGSASGSTPLKYQWFFTDSTTFTNTIAGATTNIYTIASTALTDKGSYFVIVTNNYGKATSGVVSINVLPKHFSNLATQLWTLAPGSQPYLTGTGTDTQRGMGYDPIYQRLVLASRSPTNGIHLLDAATGADQGELDLSAFGSLSTIPGTFQFNQCGVADDGIVYVANLITSGNADFFTIYAWTGATNAAAMTTSFPDAPYSDNPLPGSGSIGRIGDTMAVRGAGTNTQILCTFRNGTNAAVFTTADGVHFTFNLIAITNLAASIGATDPFTGASPIGLGVSFGAGDTFWAKSSSYNLRQIGFDLASGSGWVMGSYPLPTTEAPLGVDPINGYAALLGVNESPQNLPIYDLATPNGPDLTTLVDRELLGASNANGNGTGSVIFDVAGGRVFALDSNSGILALTYAPRLNITSVPRGAALSWSGPGTLQSAPVLTGPYVDVVTTSPYTNTAASQIYFRVKR